MRPKKSNALPKYVFAKQKTLQHPKGVLYFERRGWPSVKFQTQDPTAPEFWVEYAAFMYAQSVTESWHPPLHMTMTRF